ncbi:MAG: hypothetical protein DRN96_00535 [Thermoproteota archaeon]|nr:MAG: hypothetical protein DRN96_00535 [Candidatus Korarchaeota archaeon]RLG53918.1 MAG: hypothetical protein DRN99_06015 [Candidatus Korarchaeota archaeon]
MFSAAVEEARKELDRYDEIREKVFKLARDLQRSIKRAISLLVRGALEEAQQLITSSLERYRLALRSCWDSRSTALVERYLSSVSQELAEAAILLAILKGDPIPTHADLGIPSREYLLGLADVAGELRRIMLTKMLSGDLEYAERCIELIDDIYSSLSTLVYPEALIPIRPKVDYIRGLLDRCRSDFLSAKLASALSNRAILDESM